MAFANQFPVVDPVVLPVVVGATTGSFTQEEVQKIIDELDYQLKHLKERFSGKRAFSLSSSEEPDEQ